jgi:membrane-bound inhibitor of C-type lysozyme
MNMVLFGITTLTLLSGCEWGNSRALSVTGGSPVSYHCEQDQRVQVSYFSLSDRSLNFIKLALPNGQDYTLPQAVAASGTRYSDERNAMWWSKGDTGMVELRDSAGHWQPRYRDCRQQP